MIVDISGYRDPPSERKWVRLPAMLARIRPCVTVWQGKLIVARDRGSPYQALSSVESFDPISGACQPMPSLPHPHALDQLLVLEDTLFAFALPYPTLRTGPSLVLHKYSLETQSWQPFPLPQSLSGHACMQQWEPFPMRR